jgi:hypothetical protein
MAMIERLPVAFSPMLTKYEDASSGPRLVRILLCRSVQTNRFKIYGQAEDGSGQSFGARRGRRGSLMLVRIVASTGV